jgi:hypothetical protein
MTDTKKKTPHLGRINTHPQRYPCSYDLAGIYDRRRPKFSQKRLLIRYTSYTPQTHYDTTRMWLPYIDTDYGEAGAWSVNNGPNIRDTYVAQRHHSAAADYHSTGEFRLPNRDEGIAVLPGQEVPRYSRIKPKERKRACRRSTATSQVDGLRIGFRNTSYCTGCKTAYDSARVQSTARR